MRTIADLHDRIVKAFAPTGEVDAAREVVVSPKMPEIEPNRAALRPLASMMRRLRHWSGSEARRVSLKTRLDAAEAADAAKARRLATVVHEIRTPLNGILGMTHLLGQTKLTAEQQNYLSGIRQSGHLLAQLVDDILDLSTMEAGRFTLNTRAENLRQQVESVVEMLAPRAHEKRIEIAATFAADLPELLDFDPARLRQVLFNVVGNAVKFTLTGGVLVRVGVADANVEIAVADTGPGMTLEEQQRLFGEFEQGGSAETRSGGTGLGLGIAARILAEFGGALSVKSRKAEGSTFTIRFPVRLGEDAPAGDVDRSAVLSRSRVLLLAPQGPAAVATVTTIEALGGRCRHVSSSQDVPALIDRDFGGPTPFTDLIVDHRLASDYACEPLHKPLHRILLVNPEERASQPQDLFDAWLIRPLRERSLVDVLSGRLRGFVRAASMTAGPPLDIGMGSIPVAEESLDVILAEDDPVGAALVRAVLQKGGHRVRWVPDVDGLVLALGDANLRPDLVITDVNMPGGDPLDVVSTLRRKDALSGRPSVPVIVMTGDAREVTVQGAVTAGADRVLQKPLDPARILIEIGAVMIERRGRHYTR
jgi:signal transduction histidine kinase/CheY-like chemotaxis protein